MPSSSKAQARFMAAVAHNPKFAKAAGVPQSVGKEFNAADKGRKFGSGGDVESDKARELRHARTLEKLSKEELAEANAMKKGGTAMATKKFVPFEKSKKDVEPKGMKEGSKKEEALDKKQSAFAKGGFVGKADGIAQRGKTQAKQVAMCGGGKVKGK